MASTRAVCFLAAQNGKENSCGYFEWAAEEEEGSIQPVNSFVPEP